MSRFNRILFKSDTQTWRTPKAIYQSLNKEFNFDFDPCPDGYKELLPDGLTIEWGKRNFCNPPYREIKKWVQKAYEESEKNKIVVLLIPSRTDTLWWHNYIMKAHEIRFIKGRLKFGNATTNAPFPSCIVVFKNP